MFATATVQACVSHTILLRCKDAGASNMVSHKHLEHGLKGVKADELLTGIFKGLKIDTNTSRCKYEFASTQILHFAKLGFPSDHDFDFKTIQCIHQVVLAWLIPSHMKQGRGHAKMWQLSATIASVSALHDIHKNAWKRSSHRVILRAFGEKIQFSLLGGSFDSKEWKTYIAGLFASFWRPELLPKNRSTLLYFCFAMQQKAWYTGKANLFREHGLTGATARYREHVLGTYKQNVAQKTPKRYSTWACAYFHEFCFLPCVWHNEKSILGYERFVIQHLQAPMQDRVKNGSFRPQRDRPWKRFRKKLSFQDELDLNICKWLRDPYPKLSKFFSAPEQIDTFDKLCNWTDARYGMSRKDTINASYNCRCVQWLALYMCSSGSKLDYSLIWQAGALRLMLGTWNISLTMSRADCVAVQRKVERFFVLSGIISPRNFVIKVPAQHVAATALVKKQIHKMIAPLRWSFDWLYNYIKHKVMVVRSKGKSISNVFESHIQVAKTLNVFDHPFFEESQIKNWKLRSDVFKCQNQWGINVELENKKVKAAIEPQVYQMCKMFRIDQNSHASMKCMINESNYTWKSEAQISLEHLAKSYITTSMHNFPKSSHTQDSCSAESNPHPKVEPATFREGKNETGTDAEKLLHSCSFYSARAPSSGSPPGVDLPTCSLLAPACSSADAHQGPRVEPATLQVGKTEAGVGDFIEFFSDNFSEHFSADRAEPSLGAEAQQGRRDESATLQDGKDKDGADSKGNSFFSSVLQATKNAISKNKNMCMHVHSPQPPADTIAVTADKDSKRRIFMDRQGYVYRMVSGFIGDTKYYTWAKKCLRRCLRSTKTIL